MILPRTDRPVLVLGAGTSVAEEDERPNLSLFEHLGGEPTKQPTKLESLLCRAQDERAPELFSPVVMSLCSENPRSVGELADVLRRNRRCVLTDYVRLLVEGGPFAHPSRKSTHSGQKYVAHNALGEEE